MGCLTVILRKVNSIQSGMERIGGIEASASRVGGISVNMGLVCGTNLDTGTVLWASDAKLITVDNGYLLVKEN